MTVALARFTLKDANVFLLADALGDIDASDSGLFWDDTRMLSRLQLQVADSRPSFLGAEVSHDNVLFTAQLTNRPLPAPGEHSIPQGVIHLERTRFLWSGQLYERLKITNFSGRDAQSWWKSSFAARPRTGSSGRRVSRECVAIAPSSRCVRRDGTWR
jgi:glycogen debranching enzyme